MKKANVEKLEIMAQDYLQYRYKLWLNFGKRDADWSAYDGACEMLRAFGCEWRRHYMGENIPEQEDNIKNYTHTVIFPNDEKCNRLNEDAWKD